MKNILLNEEVLKVTYFDRYKRMKWGNRKYQIEPSGKLTEEGKKRYFQTKLMEENNEENEARTKNTTNNEEG